MTATIHGVGTATTGLSLEDENGFSVCSSPKIVSYSKVECLTSRGFKKIKEKKYCTNHKTSIKGSKGPKTLEECVVWVGRNEPTALHFFWRPKSDWLCAACPASYDGTDTGASNSDTDIYSFVAVGTKS